MFVQGSYSFAGLNPVALIALEELHEYLMEMDNQGLVCSRGSQPDLLNVNARSAAIWTFKHLLRLGHSFKPHLVERWALSIGWRNSNSLLLRDYAEGVIAGARFHTGPNPFGLRAARWPDQSAETSTNVSANANTD